MGSDGHRGGNVTGGGGILNNSALTLTNSTVSNNTAKCERTSCQVLGGAILNGGTLTLTNSTVSGNRAKCKGASCFAGGGGIDNNGISTLTNGTVSGNSAKCKGGSCDALGGGIYNQFLIGDLRLTNTIIAKNLSGGDCSNFGDIFSIGFNLDSDNTCELASTGDLPGVDPLLGPLQSNGGPTETHALLPGSPAIDAVTSGCPPPATDQRGVARPQGTHCDIGAYERGP